jgi:hypothetical protein
MTSKKKFFLTVIGTSLLSIFIGAAASYYFAVTKVASSASALTLSTMTFAHIYRERKEIELLSQILSYSDKEHTTANRKALCSLLEVKVRFANDLYRQYKELYATNPELKRSLDIVAESISSDMEIAKQATLRSSCAKT